MGRYYGERIDIPVGFAAELLAHAREEAPNECCGLLVDCFGTVSVRRMRNADASPESFRIDPREQFDALREIEADGKRLVAIYHSHPAGTPTPSERDLAFMAGWPSLRHLIVAEGVVRAYTASGEPL